MELEESIKTLNSYKKAFIFETEPPLNDYAEALEIVLHYIKEESIPRAVVKEEIKKLDKTYKEMKETSDFIIADTIQPKIEILQEILNKGER